EACGLADVVPLLTLPPLAEAGDAETYRRRFREHAGPLTHLVALERVGPSHTPELAPPAYVAEVPAEHHDRCHTMRGLDITDRMSPAHWLFAPTPGVTTIGIGDGGNEIGMGKVPWEVVRRNIPRGAIVACRVATDHLIVCGISNWGAYALATGVRLLRGAPFDPALFDPKSERRILQWMVEGGRLVDGVIGEPFVSGDGLTFDRDVGTTVP